jgi:hypothetical protein
MIVPSAEPTPRFPWPGGPLTPLAIRTFLAEHVERNGGRLAHGRAEEAIRFLLSEIDRRDADLRARDERNAELERRGGAWKWGAWKEHVPVTNEQHNPESGLISGFCIRCRRPWPCIYSPESPEPINLADALSAARESAIDVTNLRAADLKSLGEARAEIERLKAGFRDYERRAGDQLAAADKERLSDAALTAVATRIFQHGGRFGHTVSWYEEELRAARGTDSASEPAAARTVDRMTVDMYCRDIKQWADDLGNPRLPKRGSDEHNALLDARWNKLAWDHLSDIKRLGDGGRE